MLNLRYYDDRLALDRQAELLEKDRKKRLVREARGAARQAASASAPPRRGVAGQRSFLPRLAFRRG